MKENWFAILMFSVIFGILGFLLGRSGGCKHHCHPHHKACQAPGGACGGENVFIMKERFGDANHDEVHAIIHEMENSDFEGDTTFTIGNATVNMTKSGDGEVKVEVSMSEDAEWHGKDGAHTITIETEVETEE